MYIMLTETEWRQRELNKKIEKLNTGYYNTYYYMRSGLEQSSSDDNIIVFVKHLSDRDKKNCCNISGLVCDLI